MIGRILKIASSVSLARIITVLGGFVSMMMVGSFGKSALAAAVIAVLTVNMVYVINISLLQALPVLIRQYRQQMRSIDEIGSLIKQSYWIALICAFISSLILLRMDKLLLLIGQDPGLIALTKDYFHYSAFTIYPALMLSVFSQINIGFERLRTVLIIEFIATVLRIVWSYGFILGGYGFSMLGLSGVAKADLVANLMMLALITLYISKSRFYKPLNLLKHLVRFDGLHARKIWRLGLPMAFQSGGEFGALLTSIFLMGYYGVAPLAALQVSNQYLTLCMILGFGFTQAVTILTREALYSTLNQQQLIVQYLKTALGAALTCNIPIALLFLLCPQLLLSLFITSKSTDLLFLSYCEAFFGFNALIILLDGARSVLTGVLRGLNDTTNTMLIGLFSLWGIAIPCSVLSLMMHSSPQEVRLGVVIGFFVWVILLSLRVYKVAFYCEKASCSTSPITAEHGG